MGRRLFSAPRGPSTLPIEFTKDQFAPARCG